MLTLYLDTFEFSLYVLQIFRNAEKLKIIPKLDLRHKFKFDQ